MEEPQLVAMYQYCLLGKLAESEDARIIDTNKHTNDEQLQVLDVIDSEIDSDEGSKCNMEYSDFMVDDEKITNFGEEEYKWNFMNKDCTL